MVMLNPTTESGTDAVPAGYKRTEVGIIPEDWDVTIFGNLYKESSRNGIYKSSTFQGYGTRIVNMGEMFGIDFISNQNMNLVFLTNKELLLYGLHDGDLLFGRRSIVPEGAGKCSLVINPISPVVFESSIIRVRLNRKLSIPLFYFYFFNSLVGRTIIQFIVSGTNIKGIRATELLNLRIVLPSLSEQWAIAEVLSDTDALITALDRLIAKKRAIKQATMQQLLTGKTRLPGFDGEWEWRRLGLIGSCLRGVSYAGSSDLSPNDSDYTTRLLRSNNIQNSVLFTKDIQFVNNNKVSLYQVMQPFDILICMANGSKDLVGKSALFRLNDGFPYTFGAFMGCFRVSTIDTNPEFIFHLFQTSRYRNIVESILAGSSINNLKPSDIESVEFCFPPLAEQDAIATVLSDMDAELHALEQRRAKTIQIKQGMMQQLLTGRIRLRAPLAEEDS